MLPLFAVVSETDGPAISAPGRKEMLPTIEAATRGGNKPEGGLTADSENPPVPELVSADDRPDSLIGLYEWIATSPPANTVNVTGLVTTELCTSALMFPAEERLTGLAAVIPMLATGDTVILTVLEIIWFCTATLI